MNDFVAVGDIVVDVFIKLKDARVACDINDEHCTITMAFGDKIPYESVDVVSAVGNAPNASVAAARLGLKSALITNLGEDEHGRECLKTLTKEGVDIKFITTHSREKTNYHYVLWYENDRSILVKHEHYKYKFPNPPTPKWMYLSSLGEDTMIYHSEILDYLKAHPEVLLAFQPGTFQMRLGKEKLKEIYERTNIFFCNVEEAERILGIDTLGIQELLKRMRDLGPKIVVITDGPKGAYAYDPSTALGASGSGMWFQPPYPDQKPAYERTGAGDSFASTCVAALALGKDLPTALQWGSVNSMSVVQQVGAQRGLLTRPELEKFLKEAPEEFKSRAL